MQSEVEGLKQQEATTIEFLNFMRSQLAIQSDTGKIFTLRKQIAEKETELNAIRKKIQKAYGLDVFEESSLLEEKIKSITIDAEIGEIHLVNCNREKVRDRFWNKFDENLDRQNPFQFYFLVACPSQQPDSFSERMIYELIDEELDGEFSAINYRNRPDSNRVKIDDLPLGRNLRNCQKDFKKYFTKRFGMEAPFEDYLQTGLPKLDQQYEYVVTVFDLNASKWNTELMKEYLQWIIDSFSKASKDVPQFLFFFAFFVKNAHGENLSGKELEALEGIQAIVNQNSEKCSLLTQLLPVPTDLLEDWIRDLGEGNQSKIEDVIKSIVMGLPEEKQQRFRDTQILDMTDIERFQAIVYKIANG